jgi:dihydrodipicolinate synthase/N-acetylneuraminate lyase
MLLEGLHIPLTTPFHPDGRLNLPKLGANVARTSKSPAAGLIVLGQQGEPTLLTDDESREVLRAAAQAAAPEKVLLAGISRDSVRATLALAHLAAELLYDAILAGVPSIFAFDCPTAAAAASEQSRSTQRRELLLYFQTIADRSPLPVVLFSNRDHRIPLEATVELAAHPNILGLLDGAASPSEIEAILRRTATIKREVTVTTVFRAVTARMKAAAATHAPASLVCADSLAAKPSADSTAIAEPPATPALRTRTKSVGFQVLSGDTQTILDALRAGAVGIAPAFAAAAPQACYEVFAAWKDDDQSLAEEKQARLCAAARLAEDSAGNLKFACDLNGYFGGLPRLPQLPPTGSQRAGLEQLMKQLRN